MQIGHAIELSRRICRRLSMMKSIERTGIAGGCKAESAAPNPRPRILITAKYAKYAKGFEGKAPLFRVFRVFRGSIGFLYWHES
jgi:hypothetical protein